MKNKKEACELLAFLQTDQRPVVTIKSGSVSQFLRKHNISCQIDVNQTDSLDTAQFQVDIVFEQDDGLELHRVSFEKLFDPIHVQKIPEVLISTDTLFNANHHASLEYCINDLFKMIFRKFGSLEINQDGKNVEFLYLSRFYRESIEIPWRKLKKKLNRSLE